MRCFGRKDITQHEFIRMMVDYVEMEHVQQKFSIGYASF